MILATVQIRGLTPAEASLIATSHPEKVVFTYEEDDGMLVKVKGTLNLLVSASEAQLDSNARKFAEGISETGEFRWETDEHISKWQKV